MYTGKCFKYGYYRKVRFAITNRIDMALSLPKIRHSKLGGSTVLCLGVLNFCAVLHLMYVFICLVKVIEWFTICFHSRYKCLIVNLVFFPTSVFDVGISFCLCIFLIVAYLYLSI